MNIEKLVTKIVDIDDLLKNKASSAINILLTLRNWLIGYYIVEYEQKGEEKAKYNSKLIKNLSENLKNQNLKNMSPRELRRIRLFYKTYNYFDLFLSNNSKRGTLSPVLKNDEINDLLLPIFEKNSKRGVITPVLKNDKINDSLLPIFEENSKRGMPSPVLGDITSQAEKKSVFEGNSKRGMPSPVLKNDLIQKENLEEKEDLLVPAEKLISNLAYSHFIELIKIEDNLKRTFYELECMKGTWTVVELKRQINSLYFERSGLSNDKEKLSALANEKVNVSDINSSIKNQFVFEFLNIPTNETLEEQALEKGLMDNLQSFLLELGYGFCFESRQKRILIDDEYFYIDLVFYHRILKCHVIIELKTEGFNYNNMGQLNTYLQYYKEKMMEDGDNLPIGILLCTDSKPEMVKYALADKENMYVSHYELQLPSKKELKNFIASQLKKKPVGNE